MALRVENLGSGHVARVAWTTTPAAYDIVASDPFKGNLPGLASPGEGRPCRRLIAGSTSTIVYTGIDGVAVTFTASFAGQVVDVQAIALSATSTATNVVVVW